MKLRLKKTMAGPAGVRHPGDIIEVSATEAAAFISGGYAESAEPPVKSVPPVEATPAEPEVIETTAVEESKETAVPAQRYRRRTRGEAGPE